MSAAGILALTATAALVALLIWTSYSTRDLKGRSVEGLETILPGLAAHRARAAVFCYSEHCGHCRDLAPRIEQLAQVYPNLFRLDLARHPAEARALGIRAVPTSLLVEDGKVSAAHLGAHALRPLEAFLRDSGGQNPHPGAPGRGNEG